MEPSRNIKKAIRVLEFARKYDVELTTGEAQQYLDNRLRLKADPEDGEAQRVATHYKNLFYLAGTDPEDFGAFLAWHEHRCPHPCPECNERNRRADERSLALFRESREREAEAK